MIPLQIPQYGKKSKNIFLHLSGRSEKPAISHNQVFLSSTPPELDSRCLAESSRQFPLTELPPDASSSVAREPFLPEAREGQSRPAQRPAGEVLTAFPLSASLRVRRMEKRGTRIYSPPKMTCLVRINYEKFLFRHFAQRPLALWMHRKQTERLSIKP